MQPGKPAAGIKVFGSAVLRVDPDLVSLRIAVWRQAKQPKDAFRETHHALERVRAYLTQAGIADVAGSHITLSQAYEYVEGRNRPTGYQGQVGLNVLLADLKRLEEVLVGVVDAGANQIAGVEFRTSRLKEFRAEARRRAVESAREKAEVYCRAAGIEVGPVISLEDVHPEALRGTGEGNTSDETPPDDGAAPRVFAPGSIVVGAAVTITFAIDGRP
jgi:uncharacterized protein YggE